MKRLHLPALIAASLLSSFAVHAELTFNGFASIKAGVLFDSNPDLNNNGVVDSNEMAFSGEITEDIGFKDLSLFAIQATSDLGGGLSATVQLMSEGRNDFEVDARWAYFSYQLSDTWAIQAGRILLPAFYKSEFSNVGYAHNYNVLPRTVYTSLPFSNVEGFRFVHNSYVGDWTLGATTG